MFLHKISDQNIFIAQKNWLLESLLKPYIIIIFVHPLPLALARPGHLSTPTNVTTCWLTTCSVSLLVVLVVFILLALLGLLSDLPCILCYFVTRIAWPMVGLFFDISSFIGSITLRRPGGIWWGLNNTGYCNNAQCGNLWPDRFVH